jgi:hypothetical protein
MVAPVVPVVPVALAEKAVLAVQLLPQLGVVVTAVLVASAVTAALEEAAAEAVVEMLMASLVSQFVLKNMRPITRLLCQTVPKNLLSVKAA